MAIEGRTVSGKKPSDAPPARAGKRVATRRGSPDVIEKRRAARFFNDALLGGGRTPLDGRTEKRRLRLLQELTKGTARGGKRELKPIDVLTHVRDLLELGEPLASIRKACPPRRVAPATPAIVEGVRRLHKAYRFPFEAYRFVGIDDDTLRQAGIVRPAKTRRAADGVGKHPGLRAARTGRGASARARA